MKSASSMLVAFFFSIAALAVAIPSQSPNPLEAIASDYRNVRGLDFIATYPGGTVPSPPTPSVPTLLGVTTSPPPNFNDVASAVAMWECYNIGNPTVIAYVDQQLDRIYDTGFNTIRVWLSYQRYRFDPQGTVNRFYVFLQRCSQYGLHVIPVLWDADFFDPDSSSMAGANYSNYTKWVRSPGTFTIQTQNGILLDNERQYIIDMVSVALPYSLGPNPLVLMWDAMNEPVLSSDPDATHVAWINETLTTIKATNSSAKTCVTPPYWAANPLKARVARQFSKRIA